MIIDFSKTYKAEKEEANLNENQYAKYASCTWFATSIVLIIFDVLLYSSMLDKKSQNQVLKLEVFDDCKKELEIKKDIKLILQDIKRVYWFNPFIHYAIKILKEDLEYATDEIVATADGKVIFADYNGTRGNTVKIEHADGNTSVYSHGSKILVKDGDSVKAGDAIMTVGSTGMATGPHLHFEIINAQGEYIDVNQMFESK